LHITKQSFIQLIQGNALPTISGIISISIVIALCTNSVLAQEINLIDKNYVWKATDVAKIFHRDNNSLNVLVKTNSTDKIYNRAILQTKLNSTQNRPLLLSLDYSSQSIQGKAIFYAEISNKTTTSGGSLTKEKILWASRLNDTMGTIINDSFILPRYVANKPIQFKLYIITDGPGLYTMNVKKADIKYGPTAADIKSSSDTTNNNTQFLLSPIINKNNTYNLTVGNDVYPIKYEITGHGNRLNNITAQTQSTTVEANVNSPANGTLIIELPKNLIDSKNNANMGEIRGGEDTFSVLVDNQMGVFDEIKNTTDSRTLSIYFDTGSSDIEIIGTQMLGGVSSAQAINQKTVVPEFGGGAASAVLVVATLGIILAYSKYNGKFKFIQRR
jgi:hypothetical protein